MNFLFRFFRGIAGRDLTSSQVRDSEADRRRRAGLANSHSIQVLSGGSRSAEFAALGPAEIKEELRRSSEESWPALVETLRALALASDSRSLYTRGHSERVTRFSGEVARIMGFPEEEVERIRIGGLIHDVGKITIDEAILNKPAILTVEEYEVMKTHTIRGYELLKDVPFLKDILPGLQFHHEQLDGGGYPYGLTGDAIPMIARIITVADCFDAGTTIRPYQEDPAPVEYVLEVIRSAAGVKYDETAVQALVRGVRTGRIVTRIEDRTPVTRSS